ncbi:MAG: hypothetical protein KGM42_20010 [Hyphomicrobiales bacterium]|nr:hypothetical protein [Hyphomicrobiales bacterium]
MRQHLLTEQGFELTRDRKRDIQGLTLLTLALSVIASVALVNAIIAAV